jgi:hypothetical protein
VQVRLAGPDRPAGRHPPGAASSAMLDVSPPYTHSRKTTPIVTTSRLVMATVRWPGLPPGLDGPRCKAGPRRLHAACGRINFTRTVIWISRRFGRPSSWSRSTIAVPAARSMMTSSWRPLAILLSPHHALWTVLRLHCWCRYAKPSLVGAADGWSTQAVAVISDR